MIYTNGEPSSVITCKISADKGNTTQSFFQLQGSILMLTSTSNLKHLPLWQVYTVNICIYLSYLWVTISKIFPNVTKEKLFFQINRHNPSQRYYHAARPSHVTHISLVVLTCFQLCHTTLRDIALTINSNHADVVGEATHEVCEFAGLWGWLATRYIFLYAKGLDNVEISSATGLPLHKGCVVGAVQYSLNIFRRTRHWRRREV